MEKPIYQEVLEAILKALVNHPEEVKVQRTIDEMGVLLKVKVHPQDMGLILGRKGENIKSIKNIVKAIGMKNYARVNIKIEEPTPLQKSVAQRSSLKSEEIIKELKEL